MGSQHPTALSPQDGSIVVRTYREGPAAKAGHDLIIDVTGWEATVDLEAGHVTFDVDPSSLEVREGVGGVKPLSDSDRERIRATIDDKVLHGRPISFRSDDVRAEDGRLVVSGALTLAGEARPLRAELAIEDGRCAARSPSRRPRGASSRRRR